MPAFISLAFPSRFSLAGLCRACCDGDSGSEQPGLCVHPGWLGMGVRSSGPWARPSHQQQVLKLLEGECGESAVPESPFFPVQLCFTACGESRDGKRNWCLPDLLSAREVGVEGQIFGSCNSEPPQCVEGVCVQQGMRSLSQSFTLDCIFAYKSNEGLGWVFFPCATEGCWEPAGTFPCQPWAMLGTPE